MNQYEDKLSNLKFLLIRHSKVTSEGLKRVFISKLRSIRTLDFARTQLESFPFEIQFKLDKLKALLL